MSIEDFIALSLQIQNQIQVYHWQTESYAAHKALDEFYGTFSDLTDSFIEVYVGKYGRPQIGKDTTEYFDFKSVEDIRNDFIPMIREIYSDDIEELVEDCPDLQNIRDEMLTEINTLAYLLTLN